jgi:hypothetical protein
MSNSVSTWIKPEGETWAGWAGRQAANGTLLYLAFKIAQWMGIVVVVTQKCGGG